METVARQFAAEQESAGDPQWLVQLPLERSFDIGPHPGRHRVLKARQVGDDHDAICRRLTKWSPPSANTTAVVFAPHVETTSA